MTQPDAASAVWVWAIRKHGVTACPAGHVYIDDGPCLRCARAAICSGDRQQVANALDHLAYASLYGTPAQDALMHVVAEVFRSGGPYGSRPLLHAAITNRILDERGRAMAGDPLAERTAEQCDEIMVELERLYQRAEESGIRLRPESPQPGQDD